MKIESIKVMRGPNYWSNYRKKLIVMKLDIEALEDNPTNKIAGFKERMEALIPSLIEHRCSEGYRGGFLYRVNEGTWMGHVIEHIALEIQTLAGMECGFGRTRSTQRRGVYHVVFAYLYEEAGLYAAHAAVRIAESLVQGYYYNLQEDIERLIAIRESSALGPSTQSIVNEAVRRGIPYRSYDQGSLVVFGHGVNQRRIQATIADSTSCMGVELAGDKDATKQMLNRFNIPVPHGVLIDDVSQLNEVIETLGYPLVVKPVDGNHGRAVTTNIINKAALEEAFLLAQQQSERVIVEQFISGDDYRFLVVNYKVVAVAKRTPPVILGNGVRTIRSLIEEINNDPRRGDGHANVLTRIEVDDVTTSILKEKNYSLDTILPFGEQLALKKAANLSSGGTATNVTDQVHPDNLFLAERVARLMQLDICGLDIVTSDIAVPIKKGTGAIIEVNAAPGFRMHLAPSEGAPINVAAPVMDMLFPKTRPSRIPLVAVTGTNGKTTTTRLIAHLASVAGHDVGYTTSDGIYSRNHLIEEGDCTGALSAEKVLMDPGINFAVLECARGGILRSGLGFDHCDISVITNISEDHLGLQDIYTLDDMAAVKEVVARSTSKKGYSILNADDDRVFAMAENLDCHIALFTLQDDYGRLRDHCNQGGLGATIENGNIVVCKGKLKTKIAAIDEVPLSFSGKSECMIKNILCAALAATIQKFSWKDINNALRSFIPSPALTPGRMNLFHFHDYDVMLDYAHNIGGFMEQKKFIDRQDASIKVGIISAVGDRRDEDIRNIGYVSAQMFDEIIIRLDHDLRGRSAEDMVEILKQGIMQEDPDLRVTVIPEELEAIKYAFDHAAKGAFIAVFSDDIKTSMEYITHLQQQEKWLDESVLVK